MSQVPRGWVRTTVGELFEVSGGGTPNTAVGTYWKGSIPWISSADISDDGNISPRAFITAEAIENSATTLVPKGSVIVVTRVGLGKVAVAPVDLCYSQDNQALRIPNRDICAEYVAHFLRFFAENLKQGARGTTISGVTKRALLDLPFLLPPFAEQCRIVSAIEEHLSRLDAAVAGLERVQAGLPSYRAAVLQAACAGRLVQTEAELASAEGRSYEAASVLVDRLDRERRTRTTTNPAKPDLSDAPTLPEGWAIASVDELTTRITSGSRDWTKYYGRGSGVFLMAQNIRMGRLDLDFRQSVDPPTDDRDRARSQVETGDLLITIVGANTGQVCRVPHALRKHYVCQSVALMRPVVEEIAKYLELYLIGPEGGQRQYRRYIYGAGRPHLSFDQLRMTPVPLPPLTEQGRIVAEVERHMSIADSIESTVERARTRADRLRQAVLKQAFEGNLGPQDPNDEPADKLLERIRAQRSGASGNSRRRPQNKSKRST